ncbi:MAG: calcium/sodium antiporter, partial [Proteobacteria bacterium]|nr:calcium/sodium antiporter [Pseudomonadota bacterium]
TVIAVGTSLPELVVSMTSALKGHTDMAIGNIVGSNIFLILAVLAIPSIVSPTSVDSELLTRDYVLMLGLTMLLVLFAYQSKLGGSIGRLKGIFLLCIWVGYLVFLYNSAPGHDSLPFMAY